MKVLVTGGTGFVGGHLVEALLARGDTVAALCRISGKCRALAERGVSLVAGDLGARQALERACRGQDVVYHVGGLIAARSEDEFMRVNRDGTRLLAAAARHEGIGRFVLVSSLAAGGPTTRGRPLQGDEPARPTTRYGRSKLAGEEALRAADVPWTIVRPPIVYGPNDREMFRIFRAASVGVAPVPGDGSQELSLVFGPDLAAAIVAAGTSPATVGGTFYPAHPEILTNQAMVGAIGRAIGKRVRVVPVPAWAGRTALWCTERVARWRNRATVLSADKANEFFQPAWTCDPAALSAATGWRADHDLEAGARQTYRWYRTNGWL